MLIVSGRTNRGFLGFVIIGVLLAFRQRVIDPEGFHEEGNDTGVERSVVALQGLSAIKQLTVTAPPPTNRF